MKFEIKSKWDGCVIFSLECKSLKLCVEAAINLENANLYNANLENANLKNVNLYNANLKNANLKYVNLEYANLKYANLKNANLKNVNLENANLKYANLKNVNLENANLENTNLKYVNLENANLYNANLENANLYFSCWPLWCGSFSAKADDRLVAQLIHHVAKLNTDNCSGGVQESIKHIRDMAISDLFCEYRDDIDRIKA